MVGEINYQFIMRTYNVHSRDLGYNIFILKKSVIV